MRKKILISLAVLCAVMLIGIGAVAVVYRHQIAKVYHRGNPVDVEHVESIREYCKANRLSTTHCIIVDFNTPSGRDRMKVINLKTGKTVAAGPCAHGQGPGNTAEKPKFSNALGSGCSSVGRYEVGKMQQHANLGRIFRLKGYDKTNSHAQMRGIYIHSSRRVKRLPASNPHLELSKASEGCFTTDRAMLTDVQRIVEQSKRPLLLLAYSDADYFKERRWPSVFSFLQ